MGELKPGWRWVKLGDVVDNVNDYYDRNSTEAERYIAGEHIDEGSRAVRRWGETTDDLFPPTFNRRFRAGDILFHSRNLRKLARPDFEGVTGEKLFVLRVSRPEQLLPSLLPFLLQTRQFDEYVNRMWAGSTNKFLNKTPLLRYEFALPPLEEQRRICDVLIAIETVEREIADLKQCALVARDAYTIEVFLRDKHCPPTPLSEVCDDITVGIVVKPAQWYVNESKGVPALLMKNVQRGWLDLTEVTHISFEGHQTHAKSTLRQGDVVAVRSSGSAGRTGDAAVVPASLEGANCIDLLIARPGNRLVPEYLCEYLNAPTTRGRLVASSSGTMQKHLNVGAFRLLQIPLRSMGEQERVVAELRTLSDAVRKSDDKRSTLTPLREGAFRALLGGKA